MHNRRKEDGKVTEEEHEEDHDWIYGRRQSDKHWADLKMKVIAGMITTFFTFIGSTIVYMIVYIFNSKVGK